MAKPLGKRDWLPNDVLDRFSWSREALDTVTRDVAAIFERVARDADNGLRSAGSGRVQKYPDGGANNGPVPKIALQRLDRGDPVQSIMRQFLEDVAGIYRMSNNLVIYAGMLKAMDFHKARELVEQASPQKAMPCANCGRVVENTPNDPIRSGRCGACWQWRRRHEGAERPKDQWESDAA